MHLLSKRIFHDNRDTRLINITNREANLLSKHDNAFVHEWKERVVKSRKKGRGRRNN